ncbi:hypothetical protein [Halorussus salinisoli]|uniref:hypothetical protein n=1 Tax=Halorussus salinisoli TaxID=2558242 RepID=UPI0010C1DB36|nr:hypothetical protein [Halorussus salinisoli]
MNTKRKAVLVGLVSVTILGLALTATAGAHPTDIAEDPVSTVGHVGDHLGWHNDWGDHQHGDYWGDHPHHDESAGHHHDGAGGPHGGPAGPNDEHHGPHGGHHGHQ